MYKHNERQMIMPEDFFLPFGGKLNPRNRWCQLAAIIPWAEIEERYAEKFSEGDGQQAYSVRVAFGALYIQNRKTLSDRDLVEEISENPYMQYFLGFSAFSDKHPFSPAMLVYFRKRLGKDIINEVNEMIAIDPETEHKDDDRNDNDRHGGEKAETGQESDTQGRLFDNKGTLSWMPLVLPQIFTIQQIYGCLTKCVKHWKKSLMFCMNST